MLRCFCSCPYLLTPSDFINLLKQRSLIQDVTSKELTSHCNQPRCIYVGFDPTSDDLHLGNLMGIVVLRWAQLCGHQPVALIGGATGMIGDPSGKSKERTLQTESELEKNIKGITKTLSRILTSEKKGIAIPSVKSPIFLNNKSWFDEFNFLDFLRSVGKNFRMGPMLARDSVSSRLNSEEGLSYTEFSYQVLQAYDFYFLCSKHDVTVQAGGSDQWGNITAGIDFIGRKSRVDEYNLEKETSQAFGIVWPLLLRKDGKKFGKSEKGAIWLSEVKLSSYEFYQYILQLDDDEALNLLTKLSFIPLPIIDSCRQTAPVGSLQRLLAEQLLLFCRGEQAVLDAVQLTQALQPGKREHLLTGAEIEALRAVLPLVSLAMTQVQGENITTVMMHTGLAKSKSAARRLIDGGGCYLNGKRLQDSAYVLSSEDYIDGKWLLIASGKRVKVLLEIV